MKLKFISIVASGLLVTSAIADLNVTDVGFTNDKVYVLSYINNVKTIYYIGNGTKYFNDSSTTGKNIAKLGSSYDKAFAIEANGTLYELSSSLTETNTTKNKGFSANRDETLTELNISAVSGSNENSYIHYIALEANGTVWGWGNSQSGQLGDENTSSQTNPIEANTTKAKGFKVSGVATDLNITAIATGYLYTVALEANGSVWAWGRNEYGRLGDGTTTDRNYPVQISKKDLNITAIATGYAHTVALEANGTVWAWGFNYAGGLGDGTTTDRNSPIEVNTTRTKGFEVNGTARDLNITAIAAGSTHTLALDVNGTVWAWGQNSNKQIGDGNTSTTNRLHPVEVNLSIAKGWYYDANITKIFSFKNTNVAVDMNGTLIGWGGNANGQLGDDTTDDKINPVIIGAYPNSIYKNNNLSRIISWNAPVYPMTKYSVYRGDTSNGTFTKLIDTVENNATNFRDDSASYNKTYYYIVSAHYLDNNRFGTFRETNSSATSISFTTTPSIITTPTNSSSNVGNLDAGDATINTDVNFTHSQLSNITATTLYYKKSSDTPYTSISLSANSLYHNLASLAPNTQYNVIISETNATSNGEVNSTTLSFTTRHNPPYNLSASSITTNSITLNWSDGSFGNSNGRSIASNFYKVYKNGVVLVEGLSSSLTSYQVTGLSPSTTYTFNVSEYENAISRSITEYKSSEISATTLAEAIIQTSLINSSSDKTTQDDQKVKEEETANTFVNSADLTAPDGSGTKVTLERPKDGSDVKSKTLTLEYNDKTKTTQTKVQTDKEIDITVNIDGSFNATKTTTEGDKVTLEGDSKGNSKISLEDKKDGKTSKHTTQLPAGGQINVENSGNITATNEVLGDDGKEKNINIKTEVKPNENVTITAQIDDKTYTLSSRKDAEESNIELMQKNNKSREVTKVVYTGIQVTFKSTRGFFANKDGQRALESEVVEIVPTTAWQKYEERQYFNGKRTITLILGGAKIVRNGVEELMIQGVEYELNIPQTTQSLKQIYANSELSIKQGWNLITNPTDKEFELKTPLLTYKFLNSTWVKDDKVLKQNEGMWVNYPLDSIEKIEGNSYSTNFANLNDGWNLIGAGKDTSSSEFSKYEQVWVFNAETKKWISNPSTIYQGYGFWIK